MKKVGEIKENRAMLSEGFNLEVEMSTIVEKNMLPPRIAEKIGEKLKVKNINITKEQLYKLVEKIQSSIQAFEEPNQTFVQFNESKTTASEINADMKTLVESIEKLEGRMQNIEENKLKEMKGVTGRITKTKDIKTVEKTDATLQEGMEPLFEIPNNPESVVVLMKWLQYLVDKLGKNNLPHILGYYVDIDWISDDVRLDLIKYSKGIIDAKEGIKKEMAHLSTKDHIQSLLFIQKLKGQQLDERFIWKIDREMEKMAKSIEDYQFK
jgi:flagellar protein FlaD